MSALPTLIRVARWHLEEKRRHLVGLETLMASLNGNLTELEREIEREQAAARRDDGSIFFYANFARAAIARRANILRSIEELREQMERAQGAVTEAFQEVRRYETVWERHLEREAVEEARREQGVLDELAIEMFRRGRA